MKRNPFLTVLMLVSLTGIARAEDVWLKQPAVIRSDQMAAGDEIAKVVKGDKGVVLERAGNWVKINVNGSVGWVTKESISTHTVAKDSTFFGSDSTAKTSSASAGKGVEEMARKYAELKHLSEVGLNEMVALRKTVNAQMYKDFIAEGKIVPAKK